MRHIDRSTIAIPPALDGPQSKGQIEREQVIKFYQDPDNQGKSFEFKAYKEDSVKSALNKLTHGKCAYCESNYEATQPVDIEHFRPKGAVVVNGALRKPGYYWLAASWDNLLPSCIDCNRPRIQEFPDLEPELAGKANLFPLSNGFAPALNPGEETNEESHRLLLDPCVDFPEEHLEFFEELGEGGLVRPRQHANGQPSELGEMSIKTYGLQRLGLVNKRKGIWKRISAQKAFINELLSLFNDSQQPALLKIIETQLNELRSFMAPDSEYSVMARQHIQQFLQDLGID